VVPSRYPEDMAHALATPTLAVKTRRMSPTDTLIDWVSADNPLVMQRLGQGVVGLGETLRWEFQGPDRFAEASAAWATLVDNAHIDNPVGIPGSGLVCFGAFTFADQSSHTSVIIVPCYSSGD